MTAIITVTRKIEFDAAHRVLRHESKCANLHGHRYVACITVVGPKLDPLGRVVDFGCIKEVVGKWVDTMWDHSTLLNRKDPLCEMIREHGTEKVIGPSRKAFFFDDNPTAEVIADRLLGMSQKLLHEAGHDTLVVSKVRVYETPNCWADAKLTQDKIKQKLKEQSNADQLPTN